MTAKTQCRYLQKRPERKLRVQQSTKVDESILHVSRQLVDLSDTVQTLVERFDRIDELLDASRPTFSKEHDFASPFGRERDTRYTQSIDKHRMTAQNHDRLLYMTSPTLVASGSSETPGMQETPASAVDAAIKEVLTINPTSVDSGSSSSVSGLFARYPQLAERPMPPMEVVLRILALGRTSSQRFFEEFCHTDLDRFERQCQSVYFPTRPFTIFAWLSVNCGLFYLFRDLDQGQYSAMRVDKLKTLEAVNMCLSNIDAAMISLPLCLSPSEEAVASLMCASILSMERGRGTDAWNLVSVSARMCIDLGYHHLPAGYGDEERSYKRKLFWFVFSGDRVLAFNFRRSTNIRDCDVTTEGLYEREDFRNKFGIGFMGFVEFARLQSDIYDQLLSPSAQREHASVREHRVHNFVKRLLRLRDVFENVAQRNSKDKNIVQDTFTFNNIAFFSIITLVYRVLPAETSTDVAQASSELERPLRSHSLCIDAARVCLKSFLQILQTLLPNFDNDMIRMSINWMMIFVPLMPYIVLFGNCVTNGNLEDLKLLRDVTGTINIAVKASNIMQRMHGVFSRLLRVAERWQADDPIETHAYALDHALSYSLKSSGHFPVGMAQLSSTSQTSGQELQTSNSLLKAAQINTEDFQDIEMMHIDWDTVFNEFDFGFGAESAREMLPWFEQNMNILNGPG